MSNNASRSGSISVSAKYDLTCRSRSKCFNVALMDFFEELYFGVGMNLRPMPKSGRRWSGACFFGSTRL